MELSTSRLVSNAVPRNGLLPFSVNLRFRPPLPHNRSRFSLPISVSGAVSYRRTLLRASVSEETSSEPNKHDGERSPPMVAMEDFASPPVQRNAFPEPSQGETPENDLSVDDQMRPIFEFLEKFNIKLDSKDSYSLLLYGGGSLVSLWLLAAIVGAIDSIPLFPKLMEAVGLSFSLWFTARYLIYKRDRDELRAKIEELKQAVLGSDDN